MRHVSKSALCLVFLSSLVAGFPTSIPIQNTKGPTEIELLEAGRTHRTATPEPISTTAIANPGNNIKRSFGDSSRAVGVLDQYRQPHCTG